MGVGGGDEEVCEGLRGGGMRYAGLQVVLLAQSLGLGMLSCTPVKLFPPLTPEQSLQLSQSSQSRQLLQDRQFVQSVPGRDQMLGD